MFSLRRTNRCLEPRQRTRGAVGWLGWPGGLCGKDLQNSTFYGAVVTALWRLHQGCAECAGMLDLHALVPAGCHGRAGAVMGSFGRNVGGETAHKQLAGRTADATVSLPVVVNGSQVRL